MSQIENAAELIQDRIMPNRWPTAAEIAQIIRNELFPLVKPEDVESDKLYWGKCDGYPWGLCAGYEILDLLRKEQVQNVREIRGPIQPPEDA